MSAKAPDRQPPTLANVSMAVLPYLALLGCAGLVWTVVLGFEEPYRRLLIVSAVLLAAAPLGMALHLSFTRELTRQEKRAWIVGILGLKNLGLLGAYFNPTRRRWATERMRAKAQPEEGTREAQ